MSYLKACLFSVRFEVLTAVTEDYCLLRCGAVYFGRQVPKFRREPLPPSLG
jgi:hypothetical protein